MNNVNTIDSLDVGAFNAVTETNDPNNVSKVSLPTFEKSSYSLSDINGKPSMKQNQVDDVLKHIFRDPSMTAEKLTKLRPEDLAIAITNMVLNTLGDVTDAKIKQIKTNSEAQEYAKNQQLKLVMEQLAKQAEESKPKTGSWLANIFNWVVAAIEVVIGAVKLVSGLLRTAFGDVSGAVDAASGAAYLAAGFAGMYRACCETLVLTGVKTKEEMQKKMDDAEKVQIAFEVAGMALDLYQAGSAIFAARSLARGAKAAVVELGSQATKATTKTEIQFVAKAATKGAIEEFAVHGSDQLVKTSMKEFGSNVSALTKAFSNKALQPVLEKVTYEAVENTVKNAAKASKEVTTEALESAVGKAVNYETAKIAMRATSSMGLQAIRAGAAGASKATIGALELERANITALIQKLMMENQFMEQMQVLHQQSKEHLLKSTKETMDKMSSIAEGASKMINQTGSIQANIGFQSV